jgi:hypothetical protein
MSSISTFAFHSQLHYRQKKSRHLTAKSESHQRPTEQLSSLRWHQRCHRQATGLKPTPWDQLMSRTSTITEHRQVDFASNYKPFVLDRPRLSVPVSFCFRLSISARSIGNFPIGVGKYTWDRSIIKALGKLRSAFINFTSSCTKWIDFSSETHLDTQAY